MSKRKKPNWFLIIILLIGTTYLSGMLIRQQSILNSQRSEIEQLDLKIEEEAERNAKLIEEREKVLSDEYIEIIARRELGLVKEGEKVFVDINK
ncbi:septum formation initiator family protein [Herbivorax sp. ANBcel31]|uniref:FtsB family cell division protein n=1 Tax=Herbivorax sp. ANBcel31 TaxID=3069754 RepID=UPI0027B0AA9E|nr:septum formation initiator family protein [Herbivorax sp. ANBcel31]MDQ2086530.1 septum formation initiator family protein [Herbivorax sp. ANBcel31]